jgi:hypothetical protein
LFIAICVWMVVHRGATLHASPSHIKPRKPCTKSSGLTHFEVTALEATSGSQPGTHFASALEAATVLNLKVSLVGMIIRFLLLFFNY